MKRPKLNKNLCPHCRFISNTFPAAEELTDREYWLLTEVFVYLHGEDFCRRVEGKTAKQALQNIFKTIFGE